MESQPNLVMTPGRATIRGQGCRTPCRGGRQADFKSPPGSDSEFFGLCSQSQGKALGTTFYVIFWKTLYMRPGWT